MAPNTNKNLGGGWVVPKKTNTMLRECQRPTCPGVCPLKVVVHKHGSVNPARCRVCERKFTIPPGAEKLFHGKDTTDKGGGAESRQVQQLKKQLEQKNKALAELRKDWHPSVDRASDEVAKPKQTVAALQKALSAVKEAGLSSLVEGLEKQLAAAKEAAEEKPGDPLKAIFGKLNAAKAREKQIQEQLRKDLEKTSNNKAKNARCHGNCSRNGAGKRQAPCHAWPCSSR